MNKYVQVKDIIKAAEKNGYDWWGKNNPSGDYCILQQVSLNLDTGPGWGHIQDALNSLKGTPALSDRMGNKIVEYNDERAENYNQALNYLKVMLTPYSEQYITINVLYPSTSSFESTG